MVATDLQHSTEEPRYAALGEADAGRRLSIVFTLRGTLVRVISARDMSRPERRIYEQAQAE
ncbi:MAG: BrnT family toxin [Gemmatimonadales bacterium]|nr:BrnT family toxin [Gemmatimonadales bacterium]